MSIDKRDYVSRFYLFFFIILSGKAKTKLSGNIGILVLWRDCEKLFWNCTRPYMNKPQPETVVSK